MRQFLLLLVLLMAVPATKAGAHGMAVDQLSLSQSTVAESIIAVGRSVGATNEEILGAISAAWSESRLNPQAVGDQGAAIGVFQQHPSYGPADTRRDVFSAARAFFTQLLATRGQGDIGTRIANVQRPAAQYRGMYAQNLDEAARIYTQVAGETSAPSEPGLLMRTWADIDRYLASLGVKVGAPTTTSTTGGTHAAGSYHYSGLARDYGSGSDQAAIARALLPLAQGPNRKIDELYYAPLNIFYDNGVPIQPSAALRSGHQNHVHAALRRNAGTGAATGSFELAKGGGGGGTPPVLGILKSLDGVLNVTNKGVADILNPIDDLRMIVARSAVVLGGLIVTTFGLILIVGAVATKSGASKVAGMVPHPAAQAASAVTEAAGE